MTAIQELIHSFTIDRMQSSYTREQMIELLTYKLEKEKEQIIKAYETAMETDIYNEPLKIGKDYYNQKFKLE